MRLSRHPGGGEEATGSGCPAQAQGDPSEGRQGDGGQKSRGGKVRRRGDVSNSGQAGTNAIKRHTVRRGLAATGLVLVKS